MAAALQDHLEKVSREFQRIQSELSAAVEAREKLGAQFSENETVKKEFEGLSVENEVYKLVGPVLVKQDQTEAKQTVETRLGYIRSEIERIEAKIKDLSDQGERKKNELVEAQTALQQLSSPPVAAAA